MHGIGIDDRSMCHPQKMDRVAVPTLGENTSLKRRLSSHRVMLLHDSNEPLRITGETMQSHPLQLAVAIKVITQRTSHIVGLGTGDNWHTHAFQPSVCKHGRHA